MGKKYSLGIGAIAINSKMSKDSLNLKASKANPIKNDMVKQLNTIKTSLTNIGNYMNTAAKKGVVKGSYAEAFKGWAKKSKEQASAANRRKTTLSKKYDEDVKQYSIRVLESRISQLEESIKSMPIDEGTASSLKGGFTVENVGKNN